MKEYNDIFIENVKIEFVQIFDLLAIRLLKFTHVMEKHINTTARKIYRSIGILNRLYHFSLPILYL